MDTKDENLDPFVGFVREKFQQAETARLYDEKRWLKAYRNYRGLYGPEMAFRDSEKSKVFVKITKTKVLAAFGQIIEVLFSSGKFPIGVRPTTVPEGVDEYAHIKPGQAQQQQASQQQQAQKVAQDWQSKVEKVRAVAPDFDEAFANVAEITFAQSTLDAVAGHEKGAEIAYLLGKDPVKAYQIASLPPMQQLMALGEIAAKTNLTKPKTVTNAPPPVKPVSGKSSIVDPNSLSMKEWVAYRNKQLRQK